MKQVSKPPPLSFLHAVALLYLPLLAVARAGSIDASLWDNFSDEAVHNKAAEPGKITYSLNCHGVRSVRECSGYLKDEDTADAAIQPTQGHGVRCDIDVIPYSQLSLEMFKREYHLKRPVIFSRAIVSPPHLREYMESILGDKKLRKSIFAGNSLKWGKSGTSRGGNRVNRKVLALDIINALENQDKDLTIVARNLTELPLNIETLQDRFEGIYTKSVTDPGNSELYDIVKVGKNRSTVLVNEKVMLTHRSLIGAASDSGMQFHRDTDAWYIHGGTQKHSSPKSNPRTSQGYVRWFIYHKKSLPPLYHIPRVSISSWEALEGYPNLDPGIEGNLPLECATSPGDVIYIPEGWWQGFIAKERSAYLARISPHNMLESFEARRLLAQKLRRSDRAVEALTIIETMLPEKAATRDAGLMYELGTVLSKKKVRAEFGQKMSHLMDAEEKPKKFENKFRRSRSKSKNSATSQLQTPADRGKILARQREIRAMQRASSLTYNRSCDTLYAYGRAQLKAQLVISAKQQAIQCIKVCSTFSKCYRLLSESVLARNNGEENVVSEQAREMADAYAVAERESKRTYVMFSESGIEMALS